MINIPIPGFEDSELAFDKMMNKADRIIKRGKEIKSMKEKSILQTYGELKLQAKELEAKLKELEPQVMNEIASLDGMKLEADYGTFSIIAKEVYTYTFELQMEEAKYKAMFKLKKAEQEKNGKAKLEAVKSILRFQGAK